MIGRARDERGVALMIAILALVVMGGLVTAAFTTTLMEFRLADNTRRAAQAFGAADFGLAQTIDGWSVGAYNSLALMDSFPVNGATPHGSGSYNGYVIRTAEDLFLVEVTGSGRGGRSQQRVGEYVRLSGITADISSALTVQGPTVIGRRAQISGRDSPPDGWSGCPEPDATQSGIRISNASDLERQVGCTEDCIGGEPPIIEDPTVSDATFTQFGAFDWDSLTAMADTIPPATYPGVGPAFTAEGKCNLSVVTNWGDPENISACSYYFPLLYVPGNLVLSGGRGQGMLLVEGDLTVSGLFAFYGVVIVRGGLTSVGRGGHFNGAVMAQNVDINDNSMLLGAAQVQYSSCATTRALKAASPASRLPSRGWVYR